MKLENYEDWKHCITVACNIPLTADYIEHRIKSLNNPSDHHTRKFIDTWGETHLVQIISWFERAAAEFK